MNDSTTTQPPPLYNSDKEKHEYSDKDFVATCLLCLFLGTLGIHRFYVGKIGTGLLQLFTAGGLGIWALIDLIMIIVGTFQDKKGRPLKR